MIHRSQLIIFLLIMLLQHIKKLGDCWISHSGKYDQGRFISTINRTEFYNNIVFGLILIGKVSPVC